MALGLKNSKSSFLSLSGILLLFCFQQFMLYYSIYYLKKVNVVLYTLIVDVPLGLYIFLGLVFRSLISSVRYSILWCIYSITLVVKMVFLTFLDQFKTHVPLDGLSGDCNDMLLSFFGLYVTPILFSLFNNASKISLFQDKNDIIVDELLHSDLGLSTTIDLWDLFLMYSHLLKYYKVEVKEGKMLIFRANLFVIFIIFVLATILLLGLVIPTVDGDYKVEDKFKTNIFNEAVRLLIKLVKMVTRKKGRRGSGSREEEEERRTGKSGGGRAKGEEESDELKNTTSLKSVNEAAGSLDMYTMAKFTFIVGFFLIDVPFLCYRLFILVKYNVFSLLLYKNFIFLFLRPYRLNMSQLAERDTAKGVQTAFLSTHSWSGAAHKRTSVAANAFEESESDSEAQMLRRHSLRTPQLRKRKSKLFKSVFLPKLLSRLSFTQPRPFTKSDPIQLSSKLLSLPFNRDFMGSGELFRAPSSGSNSSSESALKEGSLKSDSKDSFGSLDGELEEHAHYRYKMYIMRILRRGRLLPLRPFPLAVVLRHWCHFVFSRVRNFESTFFVNAENFTERKFNQITFLMAFVLSVLPRLTLVSIYYMLDVRSPREIVASLTSDASFVEKLMLQLCFAFSFAVFIMFLYSCKVFDSIFSFARDLLDLYSMMVCLHCFKSVLSEFNLTWLLFAYLFYPVSVVFSFFNNVTPFSTVTNIPFKTIGSDDSISRFFESLDSVDELNSTDNPHDLDQNPHDLDQNAHDLDDNNVGVGAANKKDQLTTGTGTDKNEQTEAAEPRARDKASSQLPNSDKPQDINRHTLNTASEHSHAISVDTASKHSADSSHSEPEQLVSKFVDGAAGEEGAGLDGHCVLNEKINKIKLLNLKIIYMLLKYSIGPVTLNHRLCSNDMVETFKIHDSLLYSQWSLFFYSLFFRVLCCFNLNSKSSTLVLALDLLFLFFYNAMSQSVRSLMFRKYEVNFIIMRLLGIIRFDWEGGASRPEGSVTFADVDKYIKLQGLFSSPGSVIPPFT